MESTAFFEKKINISPNEFNEVKTKSVDSLIEKKAKDMMENKCSEQGFVLSGTMKLLSRSMGYFESARFTGDAVYYAKLESKIIYPADGIRVVGEVIRKNKMGLYIDYRGAIRIQVPRDLHIGSEEYEEVEVGDTVEVELKRSKFQINDPYILASGVFIGKKDSTESNVKETETDAQSNKVNQKKQNNVGDEDEDKEDEDKEGDDEGDEDEGDEDEGDEDEGDDVEEDEDEDEDEDEEQEQEEEQD
jgi:hypothetical protein